MKPTFFALSLSLVLLAAAPLKAEKKPVLATEPTSSLAAAIPTEESLIIALDHTIWFQDVVYIHIYDSEEKPLINGAYSKEELASNQELKNLLRKSTRFLSIDNHHYYFMARKAE
ncbi:hypothetical protein [Cesiribacter andamanensis]|uniref:Uncharacterized protein n=1 Tax=Cesiribacter andamanensis AMV16 TaxID=1279009 RepID=M7N959_9BACT|nr:hypothetical protein [Cesiribacter andamanensis]EMR03741.1 hypothetical protein ADICEAN_01079 [Cesiribacter andamanensis AMV16]